MTSERILVGRAEASFLKREFSVASAAYSSLLGGSYRTHAELRLGLIELAEGRAQQALERVARMLQETEGRATGDHREQVAATLILMLLLIGKAGAAVQTVERFQNSGSPHISRVKWLLATLLGWAPGSTPNQEQLEFPDDGADVERSMTFMEFSRFVTRLLVTYGFRQEAVAVCRGALLLVKGDSGSKLRLERLGSEYGGWIIPAGCITSESTCYCAGVGEDVSFDLALIEKYGCTVDAFDPTPRSREFVKQTVGSNPRFRFHEVGLWEADSKLTFYTPQDPSHVSHSVHDIQSTGQQGFEAQVRRLGPLMRDLGHRAIDLLKMDIEGAEFNVIESLLEDRVPIRSLCVEYHLLPDRPEAIFDSVESLVQHGYRLLAVEEANFTFHRA